VPNDRNGWTAMRRMIAEQFGTGSVSHLWARASRLISGTKSGTSSRIRKALELSTTSAPAARAAGARFARTGLRRRRGKRRRSDPFESVWCGFGNGVFLTGERGGFFFSDGRAEARRRRSPTGNFPRFEEIQKLLADRARGAHDRHRQGGIHPLLVPQSSKSVGPVRRLSFVCMCIGSFRMV